MRPAVALGLAVPLALAAGVRAQHGLPAPRAERPIHARLARADAVAFARVETVGRGRVGMSEAAPIRGGVAARFEVKRAPSHPLPLEAGERVLLLLRGARSPYVVVDEPGELLKPADAAEEAAWTRALRQVDRARVEGPDALAARYVAWIERGPPSLRRAALRGLGDRAGAFPSLPVAAARRVAAVALDPAFTDAVRGAAAETASTDPEGRQALLRGLPGGDAALPAVLAVGLRTAADAATRERLLLDALRHPDPAIRRVALRTGLYATARDAALRIELERRADGDEDAEIRALARRALERWSRETDPERVRR